MWSASIVIILAFAVNITAFRRNVQGQLDSLEERYDTDYMRIRDDFRNLWNYIDSIDTCCANVTAAIEPTKQMSQSHSEYYEAFIATVKKHMLMTKTGLKDEKRFVRDTIGNLRKTIDEYQAENTKFVGELSKQHEGRIKEFMDLFLETLKKTAVEQQRLQNWVNILQTDVNTIKSSLSEILPAMLQVVEHQEFNSRPKSCMDVSRQTSSSGVYTLYNRLNQPFRVYCYFDPVLGTGYTFISPDTFFHVDTYDLYNVYDHALIVHKRTNGIQYKTAIRQIENHKSRQLSIQFNSNTGFQDIANRNMGPYIYVGLTPRSMRNSRTKQGYNANGNDVTFTNCDGNPNGYFVFLFNHMKVSETNAYASAVASQWKSKGTPVSSDSYLPNDFFSQFELHFGGCGAFASSRHFSDVTGAAVGLPFDTRA